MIFQLTRTHVKNRGNPSLVKLISNFQHQSVTCTEGISRAPSCSHAAIGIHNVRTKSLRLASECLQVEIQNPMKKSKHDRLLGACRRYQWTWDDAVRACVVLLLAASNFSTAERLPSQQKSAGAETYNFGKY